MSAAASRGAGILAAAEEYTARRWPVFVLSWSKVPLALCARCREQHLTGAQMEACQCLTCHGFYAATTDMDRVRDMVRLHPSGLLAIRTGSVSGLAVVDVDPPGLATMRKLMLSGLLPRTLAARTGRGGYHFYYAHPGGHVMSGGSKIAPGIDSKGDGGYVVAAPSVHPQTKRPYEWLAPPSSDLAPLPQHWADHLRPASPPPAPPRTAPVVAPDSYAAAALAAECRAVAGAAANRNDRVNTAAYSLGRLVAAGALGQEDVISALMAAAAACGLVADDGPASCSRTIRSGLRAGMSNPRRSVA